MSKTNRELVLGITSMQELRGLLEAVQRGAHGTTLIACRGGGRIYATARPSIEPEVLEKHLKLTNCDGWLTIEAEFEGRHSRCLRLKGELLGRRVIGKLNHSGLLLSKERTRRCRKKVQRADRS